MPGRYLHAPACFLATQAGGLTRQSNDDVRIMSDGRVRGLITACFRCFVSFLCRSIQAIAFVRLKTSISHQAATEIIALVKMFEIHSFGQGEQNGIVRLRKTVLE